MASLLLKPELGESTATTTSIADAGVVRRYCAVATLVVVGLRA